MSSHRATFDLLFDQIESRLKAHATAQEAEDASFAFNVYKDLHRDTKMQGNSVVLLYMGPITAQRDFADISEWGYEVQYWADCLTTLAGNRANNERADEAAGSRNRYLIKQVLDGLDWGDDRDLGLPTGTVREIRYPRIEPYPLEYQIGERSYVGARMSFDFSLAYFPAVPQGTDLTDIHIDQPDPAAWSILLEGINV